MPPLGQFATALLAQFDIERGCLPRFLGEHVEDVNGVFEFRYIEHAIFALDMNSNFDYARSHNRHSLPVRGRTPHLNRAQLISDLPARRPGEPPQSIAAVSQLQNGLQRSIIQNFYILSP